jgi:hypothetical protein
MTGILIDSIQQQKCRNNFKNFLYVAFQHINLPSPTEIQYAIADELQYRESDLIINGFRGVAKSTITGIYNAWLLDRDPENTQIIYVGANFEEAKKFIRFTRNLLDIIPTLNYLIPEDGQRDNASMFDVQPAGVKIQPSCKAVGIGGNLTGNRATHIIADDIETSENCDTQVKREKTEAQVTEFRQIVSPLRGSLLFLGTPHTEVSIYNKLHDKGIPTRIFPIKFPTQEQQDKYGDKLAPYIIKKVELDPTLVGMPTDPLRFGDEDIIKLEAEGRSKFAMQQMLDTTLSDIEKYPLKCSDLIVMDCDKEIAPEKVAYSSAQTQIIKELPCNGIANDRFHSPLQLPDIKWLPYSYIVMSIDPSGRGKDELAYTVVAVLNSQLFLLKQDGLQGGYCEENLMTLAKIAKEYKVNKIKIESNFGDGMFNALLSPILRRTHKCGVEEIRHNTQKERRIIDTLEPVMNQHRLIVDKKVIKEDYESIKKYPMEKQQQYSLFYQLTRITKDRGSLAHDDKLDCLAIAVADCLDMLQSDIDEAIKNRLDEELEAEIERLWGFSDKEEIGWFDV